MSARHMIENGARKCPVLNARSCLDCPAPVTGGNRRLRCAPCQKLHRQAIVKEWNRTHRNPEQARKHRQTYNRRHPDRVRAQHRNKVARRLARQPMHRKAAPVMAWQAGTNADLAAIASLVPQSIPGWQDIRQDLALEILQGHLAAADLRSHVRKHIAAFKRDNFEGRGYAVSLSEPRRDGRSWHDMLPDDTGRAWV